MEQSSCVELTQESDLSGPTEGPIQAGNMRSHGTDWDIQEAPGAGHAHS